MHDLMMGLLPDRAWDVYKWLTDYREARTRRGFRAHMAHCADLRQAMWGDR